MTNHAEKLANHSDPDDELIIEVAQRLRNGNCEDRRRATSELASLADDPTRFPLILGTLFPVLKDDDPVVRTAAARGITVATAAGWQPSRAEFERVFDQFDDDYLRVRYYITFASGATASQFPEMVEQVVDSLGNRLSDNSQVLREAAATALATLVEESPQEVATVSTEVIEKLSTGRSDENALDVSDMDTQTIRSKEDRIWRDSIIKDDRARGTRRSLCRVLATISEEAPETTSVSLDAIRQLLIDDQPEVNSAALHAILAVDDPEPENVETVVDPIIGQLSKELDHSTYALAMRALSVLAEDHPEIIVEKSKPQLPTILELFDSEQPTVRAAAAILCSYIAEIDPHALDGRIALFKDAVSDPHPPVRANSARTLAQLEGNKAEDILTEQYATEENPDVKDTISALINND